MRLPVLCFLFLLFLPGFAGAQAPATPTDVVAYAPSQRQVNLSWTDNANDETGYVVEWDEDPGEGETWVNRATLVPDSEVARIAILSPAEQLVRYRVAAVKDGVLSDWAVAEVLKPEGVFSLARDLPPPIQDAPPEINTEGAEARAGVPFSFHISVLGDGLFTYTASGLPVGVSVNPQTGFVSGTIAAEGVYRCFVGVEFDGTKKFEQVKYIRVLPAPSTPVVVDTDFSIPPMAVGDLVSFDIAGMFDDPARDTGVLISTLGESIILALHETATPKTVANFLGYVRRGDYNNSYLHRSAANFIIQGGGARPSSPVAAPTSWVNIPAQDPVLNEPGISNRRGTIAMAKMGGFPDSATSEWFLSTGINNPFNLDFQNGGFSAFGQIVGGEGLGVALALNNLPKANYKSLITGTTGVSLESIPVLQNPPPAIPGPNTFVRITSITEVEPIAVTVASIIPSTILDAAVYGTELYVQSKGPSGVATLTLQAINVDGNIVDFPVRVEVIDTNRPGIVLTRLKKRGATRLLVKGRAADDNQLANWKYRINKKAWKRGGRLKGTFTPFSKVVKGVRRGRNILEVQAFDTKGNRSAVLREKFRLN